MSRKRQAKTSIAQRAKEVLKVNGRSVTHLAHTIGRPRPTVSRVLHGANFPNVIAEIEQELAL